MNWAFIAKYLPVYEEAAWLTVKTGTAGIVLSVIIGIICAGILYYRVPVLRRLVSAYVEISRNTPLLVQLFFIYYGIPKVSGIKTDAFVCGIVGLAFLGAAICAKPSAAALRP